MDDKTDPRVPSGFDRRSFIAGAAGSVVLPLTARGAQTDTAPVAPDPSLPVSVTLRVNGEDKSLQIDVRTTVLDALREHAGLTGTKKGCDHGQCGACTVLIEGRRVLSCLTLALSAQGQDITTIEGIGRDGALHPMQQAFIDQDAFQCGYCTPGQICSAVAVLDEARAGHPSSVTADIAGTRTIELADEEIRERMSGNLCRCGAYPNIVNAVRRVAGRRA
jgi:xanthine dehydrogenase YagT iron-sulfur-binding subunit